jgi:hypothetical protein
MSTTIPDPDADDNGPSMTDILQEKLDAVSTREEKLAILEEYMGPSEAVTAIGFIMGEEAGDLIEVPEHDDDNSAAGGHVQENGRDPQP